MRRLSLLPLTVAQIRLKAVPRPSFCTYLVSYRCNARCGMCDSWRMKPGVELSADQVRTVFRKIGRLDVVRLTGGEPFLREDFAAVADAVYQESRPWVLHVTTNGSFPERVLAFARSFEAPRRLQFMVSFDGLADEHDRSRGKDVTFDKAIETVERLVAERHRGVSVSINHTVISAASMRDHDGLRARMDALGVPVQSVLAYADSSMYGLKLRGKKAEHLIVPSGYPLHRELQGQDVIGFVERELANVDTLPGPRSLKIGKRYYLRGLLSRLRHETKPSPKPPCVALRSHLRLLPDGRVPVCQFNTEAIGNLHEQTFDSIWHNPTAQQARGWVDSCPGCWAECEVMPSAMYSGDILVDLVRQVTG